MYMHICPHLLGDDMHTHVLGGAHTCWEACVRVGGRVYGLGCGGGVCSCWVQCMHWGHVYALGGAHMLWEVRVHVGVYVLGCAFTCCGVCVHIGRCAFVFVGAHMCGGACACVGGHVHADVLIVL